MDEAHDDGRAEISRWLIADARVSLDPVELIAGFCERLTERGVPLGRLRAGQRLANPLASAWGVIWTRAAGAHEYLVARTTLSTDAFYGSPFQFVVERRATFRRRLHGLDPERDHQVLHEMAAAGGAILARNHDRAPNTRPGERETWTRLTTTDARRSRGG